MMKGMYLKMKNNNFKAIVIVAMIVSVVCISVAFAALNATLTIEGTATVTTTNAWKISFTDVKNQNVGSGVVVSTAPTATTTPNLTWAATFKAPKNSYQFTATITNGGTIPAKLESATYLGIEGEAYTDIADTSEKTFVYTVTIDGQPIDSYAGYVWAAGASKDIVVTVTFDENGKLTADALTALNTKLATFTLNLPFTQATDAEVTSASNDGKLFTA